MEHPDRSISEAGRRSLGGEAGQELGEPAGVVALTLRSPTRSRESRIANGGTVAGFCLLLTAYCLLPTVYCLLSTALLLYYLDPLECEEELCPPPPPPDAA